MDLTGGVRGPMPGVIAVVTLLTLGTACSSGGSHPAPSSRPPASTAVTTSPAPPAPQPALAPLTGKPGLVRRPVVVVKIENAPVARPQSGLGVADIVVEELVEGGITRFAAMFQSADPGTVGPVRSIRNVDAAIAGPTHGILAFSGGAAPALAAVGKTDLRLVQEGDRSGAYSRLRTRPAPHNLYLRVAAVWSQAGATTPRPYLPLATASATATGSATTTSPGSAATTAPAGSWGQPATAASLSFSVAERPSWTFDRRTGQWLRCETGGRPAVDARGSRLSADSVLILRVRIGDAGYRDPIGNPVPETLFTGSGAAILLSGGQRATGTWSKPGGGADLRLTGADGQPLLVPPGRTWIELVPIQGDVRLR